MRVVGGTKPLEAAWFPLALLVSERERRSDKGRRAPRSPATLRLACAALARRDCGEARATLIAG